MPSASDPRVSRAPGSGGRAVFFDIGDTLVHRPAVGPGHRIARALGLSDESARAITRLVFREPFESPGALAARLRRDFRLGDGVDDAIAGIWRAQETEPIENAGATDCVAAARRAGARIGIVSNIWPPYASGFRHACPGIVPLVDTWHLSYEAGIAKPDPALFSAALNAAGVDASQAIMVGDSLEKDIVPAAAMGMRTVWIPVNGGAGVTVSPDARDAGGTGSAGAGATCTPHGCAVARDLEHARELILTALGNRDRTR